MPFLEQLHEEQKFFLVLHEHPISLNSSVGAGALSVLPHPFVKLSIVGSLCDRELACSASDLQGLNFESWMAVSFHLSHHPEEVLLAQFSLYVLKSGLKPDSFY